MISREQRYTFMLYLSIDRLLYDIDYFHRNKKTKTTFTKIFYKNSKDKEYAIINVISKEGDPLDLKKLEVPTSSITEVKRSPMDIFAQARKSGTGVYIFNREKVAGVMLTKEQYETLLQEIEILRNFSSTVEETQRNIESDNDRSTSIVITDVIDELDQALKQSLITGITISAKNLDERMVSLGFITKKNSFGSVVDMISEVTKTGKISYQLRRKPQNRTIIVEIIGEQDSQSQLFDKIIIKKIYLHEL